MIREPTWLRFEMEDQLSASCLRVVQIQNGNLATESYAPRLIVGDRHGSETDFEVHLHASSYPHLVYFTDQGAAASRACFFNIWSDKEIGVNVDGLTGPELVAQGATHRRPLYF